MPVRFFRIAALPLALLVPHSAAAQEPSGRIDVAIREDARGAPLRSVKVRTIGPEEATAVTDDRGMAHFVDLDPGEYTVLATLPGYNDYYSVNVQVAAGTAVPLRLWMSIGGAARQVDARIDAPAVDPGARTASTVVSDDELQRVPWTRDPWTVLQTVPAVVVDRVNVGGAESGQQLIFEAKGAAPADNTWSLEGVPITSMSAAGSSSTYLDFGMLRELRATTGGGSPHIGTPGVHVGVVLGSGGNQWRGSGRAYFGHPRLQSENVADSMRPGMNSYSRAGDYRDFGAEGGGPIVKGRIFGWGGAGRTEPERRIFASGETDVQDVETARDSSSLSTFSAKLTATIDGKTHATFAVLHNDKKEIGYGASATRPLNAVFDEDAPASFFKAGIDRRLRQNAFLSARYGHVGGGLTLRAHAAPQIGLSSQRPQDYAAADVYLFPGTHQLTFGSSWRRADDRSTGEPPAHGQYWTAYASDVVSRDRLAVAVAARFERARSSSAGREIVWTSVTPRVGVTYAAGQDRTTVLRGSYAIFPSQLPALAASPAATPPGEGDWILNLAQTPATIERFATPLTHELVVGGDRYLSSGITVTALLTWRRMSRFNWVHFRDITASDFVPWGRLTGEAPGVGAYDVPLYQLEAAPTGFEPVYERRAGYHQRYWGLEVAAAKRFSNSWALRLGFSTNDHREYFDGPDAMAQPTPTVDSPIGNGGMVFRRGIAPSARDVFMMAPRYQLAGTASYRIGFGMDVSAEYALRQGYATPFHASSYPIPATPAEPLFVPPGDVLLVTDISRERLPMAHTLDARFSKAFSTRGVRVYTLHLDLDVFNVFNRAIVLARGYDLSSSDFNRILGITNPRMLRVGARVNF